MHQSVINAFQKVLEQVETPVITGDFPSQFALKRFAKKFEVPDSSKAASRKAATFDQWVAYDESLKSVVLPDGNWYKARLLIHKIISDFRYGELTFTGGSQSEPLHGMQAISDKLLTHKWEVSPGCADLFVDLAIRDQALLRAAKTRMQRSMSNTRYRKIIRRIYNIRGNSNDVRKYVLYWNLESREASRFSTVRKNNDIDRSIDLQPFVNMLVQRAIGLGIRSLVKEHFHIDLTEAQWLHGVKLEKAYSDVCPIATIDLKNASDSVTWSLIEFLFPKWFVRILEQATPDYTEGLDGHYYVTNKISSMGNGFTFELMTLVLLSCTRQLDIRSSVYGDDIIVAQSHAKRLITALQSVGFVVNEEKSFVNGPFRESCGSNYHDEFGYIESYDFKWPETIGDCMTFFNKASRLKHIEFFGMLVDKLRRVVPTALRGPTQSVVVGPTLDDSGVFDSYFWYPSKMGVNVDEKGAALLRELRERYNWPECFMHYGYEFRPRVRAQRRTKIRSRSLLYFEYMQGNRRADVVYTGKGDWVRVAYISDGFRSIRLKSAM